MCLRTGLVHGFRTCKCSVLPPVSLSKFPEHLPRRRYSSRELLNEAYCQTKLKFKCKYPQKHIFGFLCYASNNITVLFLAKKLPKDVNTRGVFACNELDLSEVKVYGFDYDYTLAHYKPSMEHLLYNLGRQILLEKFNVGTQNIF